MKFINRICFTHKSKILYLLHKSFKNEAVSHLCEYFTPPAVGLTPQFWRSFCSIYISQYNMRRHKSQERHNFTTKFQVLVRTQGFDYIFAISNGTVWTFILVARLNSMEKWAAVKINLSELFRTRIRENGELLQPNGTSRGYRGTPWRRGPVSYTCLN